MVQQSPGLFFHGLPAGGDRGIQQGGCLRQVGRDDKGARKERFGQRADGILIQKLSTAFGDHHRVQHDGNLQVVTQTVGDHASDVAGGDHADLHRMHCHIGEDGLDLLGDEGRRYQMHSAHPLGVLCGEGRERRHGVGMVGGDGFDIRLNARAAGRIGAGNGQDVGDGVAHAGSPSVLGKGNASAAFFGFG